MLFNFQSLSIWVNLAIYLVGAVVIWLAGSRLSRYADIISDRTGLKRDFIGLLLLAMATSLPELSTTVTAAVSGNADLAVNNLLGGIVMQTSILAIADAAISGEPLTFLVTRAALLLQAASLIVLLALTLAGSMTGPIASLAGIGFWPVILFVVYVLAMYLEYLQRDHDNWRPANPPEQSAGEDSARTAIQQAYAGHSTRVIVGFFAVGGFMILIAGVVLAGIADAFVAQTGLSAGFVGATVLAASTSLPEVSASISAVRVGNNDMAISNIFGSHLLMIAFLLIADICYRGGPLVEVITSTEQFTLAMAIAMTAIYLIGMIERRNRMALRMGYDSIAVLILYVATVAGLYFIG